jgi:thiosulfate reductase cytochrome b subunit
MATQSQTALQIRQKHALAIRWMHWVNFPLIFTMIWSGILIYWADSVPNVGHPSQVYRVGIGSYTLFRFFPNWVYDALHAQYKLTTGLGYHFFFMWLFVINGVAYVSYLLFSGAWRDIVPTRHALRDAWYVFLHDLHLRKQAPPQHKYNAAQCIAYTLVVLMGAASCLTGLAIWKPTSLHWITTLCGGYENARWLHFWLTMGFVAFFLIHVGQVVLAGWNNFCSMVSGDELVARDVTLPASTEEPTL